MAILTGDITLAARGRAQEAGEWRKRRAAGRLFSWKVWKEIASTVVRLLRVGRLTEDWCR